MAYVLILLVIFLANGLTWLVLLCGVSCLNLLASRFSKRSFLHRLVYLSNVRSGYRAGGDPRGTQSRLIDSIQKLFTLIATGCCR